MIDELIKNNCIQIGKFQLKNGDDSKYYFDMKNLVSYPELLSKIGEALYQECCASQDFNLLCGIPIGGIPICSFLSTKYNIPMIICRESSKSYGTQKTIEGTYKKSDRCIIIDDVMTSGGSIQQTIEQLTGKVTIVGAVVVVDRQQYKPSPLDVPITSLYTKTDIVRYRLGEIMKEKKSRLCFSADLNDEDLIKLVDLIGEKMVICKIHYDTLKDKNSIKNSLIELSIKHNFLIMEDRKFIDISSIVEKQYKPFQNWIDMVTVHGLVANEVVSMLSGVVLVANMSNHNHDFTKEAIELATNNKRNVIGFVTQKRINISPFLNMTPGIRRVAGSVGDQNYRGLDDVDADILIVGRGIYQAEDVRGAVEDYCRL